MKSSLKNVEEEMRKYILVTLTSVNELNENSLL